jgi:hypothetical protein
MNLSFAESRHRVDHVSCSETGAHRMILIGEWRTEQRHDAVAEHAVNCAAVMVHRLDHGLQYRLEPVQRLFRIQLLDHLGRAADIGEQHGDLLALPLLGKARREKSCEWRRQGRRPSLCRRQPLLPGKVATAATAETGTRTVEMAARWTRRLQGRATGIAVATGRRAGRVAATAQHASVTPRMYRLPAP